MQAGKKLKLLVEVKFSVNPHELDNYIPSNRQFPRKFLVKIFVLGILYWVLASENRAFPLLWNP